MWMFGCGDSVVFSIFLVMVCVGLICQFCGRIGFSVFSMMLVRCLLVFCLVCLFLINFGCISVSDGYFRLCRFCFSWFLIWLQKNCEFVLVFIVEFNIKVWVLCVCVRVVICSGQLWLMWVNVLWFLVCLMVVFSVQIIVFIVYQFVLMGSCLKLIIGLIRIGLFCFSGWCVGVIIVLQCVLFSNCSRICLLISLVVFVSIIFIVCFCFLIVYYCGILVVFGLWV